MRFWPARRPPGCGWLYLRKLPRGSFPPDYPFLRMPDGWTSTARAKPTRPLMMLLAHSSARTHHFARSEPPPLRASRQAATMNVASSDNPRLRLGPFSPASHIYRAAAQPSPSAAPVRRLHQHHHRHHRHYHPQQQQQNSPACRCRRSRPRARRAPTPARPRRRRHHHRPREQEPPRPGRMTRSRRSSTRASAGAA